MRQPAISSGPADVVWTVSELATRVRRALESQWSGVWVEGELSNVRPHGSGHLYFTIKDEGAAVRAVMFRNELRRIKFRPEDGLKVRLFGGLTFYEPQGNFQIVASKMEPAGVGDLEVAFRQMFARLDGEGLFDPAHKKPLPPFPRIVGVVTSPSGAALRDIVSVLSRRAPHVRLVLRAVRVQGDGAAREIARGIQELDAWGRCDVMLVGRGGGSLEDLWAFNEEIVARAIHACETPIVAAVGHEVDRTIADFAADVRAATPSAGAELCAPVRDEVARRIQRTLDGGASALRRLLRRQRERVMLFAQMPAFREPSAYARRRAQDVDRVTERLAAALRRAEVGHRHRFARASAHLDALSPLAILDRGYALARTSRGVVRAAAELAPGESLTIVFGKGEADCRVESVRSERRILPSGGPQ